jgi:hypothetical protein
MNRTQATWEDTGRQGSRGTASRWPEGEGISAMGYPGPRQLFPATGTSAGWASMSRPERSQGKLFRSSVGFGSQGRHHAAKAGGE